jgi:septal ring factor EnvC (AmiA/AmiB activator)
MRIWYVLLLACAASAVHAEMWKCVNADGNTTYTNVKADARGCKGLTLEPLNSVPAPRTANQKPANFPSVDNNTQRARDADRRKILEQELAQEQSQLDAAKKQLAEQKDTRLGSEKNFARIEERLKPFEDKVKLHESNVESLRREIANIK